MIVDNIIYAGGAVASGGGGGAGGTSVSAVNISGATINKDSKVYMNTESGQKKIFQVGYSPYGIFPNGKIAIANNALYDVTNWKFEKIKDTVIEGSPNGATFLKYEGDMVFAVNDSDVVQRVDTVHGWTKNEYTKQNIAYLGDGIFASAPLNESNTTISKLDLNTGEILYSASTVFKDYPSNLFKIGNKIYTSNTKTVFEIQDTGSALTVTKLKEYTPPALLGKIFGVTKDSKYIFAQYNYRFGICQYDSKEDTFDWVDLATIPVLAKWKDIETKVYFRKETGILTICYQEGYEPDQKGDYGFYKYENGNFTELDIKIPDYKPDKLDKPLILSDDGTKFSYAYGGRGWNAETYVASTKSIEAYNLVNFENIDNTVLTGVANEEIAPDATGKVSVLLPKA